MKRIYIFMLLSCVFILSACSTKSDVPSGEYFQTVIAQTIAANPTATIMETPQPIPSVVIDLPTMPPPPTNTVTPTVLPPTGTAQAILETMQAISATQTLYVVNQKATEAERRSQMTATVIAMYMSRTDVADSMTATQIEKVKGATATEAAFVIFATESPLYQEIPWRELKSYPYKYLGQKVILEGKIVEIDAPTNFVKLEIEDFDWVDITMRDSFENIYIGDTIRVYGVWCGSGILRITWCMNEAFYQVK